MPLRATGNPAHGDSPPDPPAGEIVDARVVDLLDTGAAGGVVMRGTMLRLIGFGTGSLLAAASAIVLTRRLGVDLYGQYATIIALATLVSQVSEGGLTNMAVRDFALQAPERKARLMADRLGLLLATTALTVVVCGIFAVAAGYDDGRIWGTLAAALGLGLAMLQMALTVPLLAGLRLGVTSVLELLRQLIFVALTIGLVLAGAGLPVLLAALVPSSLAVLVVTWVLASREVPMRPALHPRGWLALARPAAALALSTGVASIYVFAAQVLTSLSASPFQTGLFAASLRIFTVIAASPGLVVTSSVLPLLARAARDDADRLRFVLQRLFEVALVAGIGVGVVLVVGAPPIIAVIAGHKYAAAVTPLRIEGAAVLGTCLTPVWNSGLLALHRHTAQLVCNLAGLAVVVAMTLALTPTIGARGAALATVAAEWVISICLLAALIRARRDLVPAAGVAPRVALAAGAALACLLLPIPTLGQVVVATVLYAGLILALRALPRELLQLIPASAARRA